MPTVTDELAKLPITRAELVALQELVDGEKALARTGVLARFLTDVISGGKEHTHVFESGTVTHTHIAGPHQHMFIISDPRE